MGRGRLASGRALAEQSRVHRGPGPGPEAAPVTAERGRGRAHAHVSSSCQIPAGRFPPEPAGKGVGKCSFQPVRRRPGEGAWGLSGHPRPPVSLSPTASQVLRQGAQDGAGGHLRQAPLSKEAAGAPQPRTEPGAGAGRGLQPHLREEVAAASGRGHPRAPAWPPQGSPQGSPSTTEHSGRSHLGAGPESPGGLLLNHMTRAQMASGTSHEEIMSAGWQGEPGDHLHSGRTNGAAGREKVWHLRGKPGGDPCGARGPAAAPRP